MTTKRTKKESQNLPFYKAERR